jgi:hypothetical protein
MKLVVIYESMYGNTHLVADAIADGLRTVSDMEAVVVPVGEAGESLLADADAVVVGGPTHVHGMTRERTRKAAVDAAAKPDSDLTLDEDAEGPGLRDWFDAAVALPKLAAAFDTRVKGPAPLTGRASKGMAKRLRAHGCEVVVEPESFLVSKENHLLPDELTHAQTWGAELGRAMRAR